MDDIQFGRTGSTLYRSGKARLLCFFAKLSLLSKGNRTPSTKSNLKNNVWMIQDLFIKQCWNFVFDAMAIQKTCVIAPLRWSFFKVAVIRVLALKTKNYVIFVKRKNKISISALFWGIVYKKSNFCIQKPVIWFNHSKLSNRKWILFEFSNRSPVREVSFTHILFNLLPVGLDVTKFDRFTQFWSIFEF